LKKKKKNPFLGLDIGTESVKAAVFWKEKAEDCRVLGYACNHYEKYGIFNTREFFKDLLKNTILKTIKEAKESVAASGDSSQLKDRDVSKEWNTVLTFNPEHLKTRIDQVSLEREKGEKTISKKEERNIKERVLVRARKKISSQFARESGILAGEIEWISFKMLEKRIDGYRVAGLAGHKGKRLDFEIMAVFSPEYYLRRIESLLKEINLKVIKILSLAESIPSQKREMFLDIGGSVSQGICFKEGRPKHVFEFNKGGHGFTETLSDSLGIDEAVAENLKKRYSSLDLQKDTEKKIRNIFAPQRRSWYNSFKDKTSSARFVPSILNIIGGGAEIPDTKDALKEELAADFKKSEFRYLPEVKKVYPKDIEKGLKILTKGVDSTQAMPLLFVCSNFNLKENEQ